ncbi:MAG: hypothetical protein NT000_12825 [Proteobacteria bacterium]|nr:hypothetical protein [Pseudomonadota bacterium]
MSLSIILIQLLASLTIVFATDLKPIDGCSIPESGPTKGKIPFGCKTTPQLQKVFLESSQVRCKVMEVKCNPKKKGEYIAVAKVDQWLKGEGPNQIEFRVLNIPVGKKIKSNILKLGRGLCADLTLENSSQNWILTKIENPTSSSDSLPTCP